MAIVNTLSSTPQIFASQPRDPGPLFFDRAEVVWLGPYLFWQLVAGKTRMNHNSYMVVDDVCTLSLLPHVRP